MMAKNSGTPGHDGHRQRLRQRFLNGGGDALPDYEMPELLLFQAMARQDTKPIAKHLIKHFGSYAGVITAEPATLKEVDGIGDATVAAIKTVQAAVQRLAHNHPSGDPKPSKADIKMTKKAAKADEKLGIQLHDHLIMTRDGHTSFKEIGLL
ncbi:MAG: JAB domain-containing protein [Rhodospirillales bacterium]